MVQKIDCSQQFTGTLQKHKWENAMTVDKYSWGFRRNMIFEDVLDMKELLYQLVSTVRLANITVTIELSLIDILRIIFEINTV